MSHLIVNFTAEKDFILRDKAGEKKYNVDLAKSLKRAKESGGKLLEGKTFYITPRVKIDVKLLRNVIIANGGQVRPFPLPSVLFLIAPCL